MTFKASHGLTAIIRASEVYILEGSLRLLDDLGDLYKVSDVRSFLRDNALLNVLDCRLNSFRFTDLR